MPTKEISAQLLADAEDQIARRSAQVNYDTREFTVAYLATNFLKGADEVSKIYSNKDLVWDNNHQSKFIESMLLGLPTAIIFVVEEPGGRIEIVDGSQRARTIVNFVRDELRLTGLENLNFLNGFLFSNLVVSRQQKFGNKGLRTIVLPTKTLASNNFKLQPIEEIRGSITVTP